MVGVLDNGHGHLGHAGGIVDGQREETVDAPLLWEPAVDAGSSGGAGGGKGGGGGGKGGGEGGKGGGGGGEGGGGGGAGLGDGLDRLRCGGTGGAGVLPPPVAGTDGDEVKRRRKAEVSLRADTKKYTIWFGP